MILSFAPLHLDIFVQLHDLLDPGQWQFLMLQVRYRHVPDLLGHFGPETVVGLLGLRGGVARGHPGSTRGVSEIKGSFLLIFPQPAPALHQTTVLC